MKIRIAMVVFTYYPADTRVRREADALIMSVDVICLRNNNQTKEEIFSGVKVYRLPLQKKRGHKIRYIWEYGYFILLSFLKLNFLVLPQHLPFGFYFLCP